VATFRRPAPLARLLESLARQKLPPGVGIEVIVVDDDPEASAAPVARRFAGGPHPVHYLVDGRRNLARARNRGVEAARGRWLAFVDDDEVAAEDWLAAYLERAADGDADGWLGPVLPRLEREGPRWLDLATFYARPRHPTGAPVPGGELRTSNAFLRRALFAGRRFDPAFGGPRHFGEDSELFARLAAAGARFAWCDEAVVEEWLPPERHRLGWLARRAYRGGYAWTRLALRGRPRRAALAHLARSLLLLVAGLALLPGALALGRRRAARLLLRACVQAGHVAGS
jgi:glycosyltransferase involved in cell wall biosynthesis